MLFLIGTFADTRQENPSKQGEARPTVIVHDLSDGGITLVLPEDPKFGLEVSQIVPAKVASVALALRPFIVIVANTSQRTIVAYSVVWRITDKDGRQSTIVLPFNYPDALAGTANSGAISLKNRQDRPVTPGEKRLVSTQIQVDSSWEEQFYLDQLQSFAKDLKQEYADAREIEITLDAVIFSDGLLIGPDQNGLEQQFMIYFESKQHLFRQIAEDLDSGKTVDQAFAPIMTLAANRLSPRDMPAFFNILAAQEINALRRRIGDAKVGDTVRSAIRKEPFVIRRNAAR
jgi:hypothetical protein